jgi:hypothetical protein
VTIGEVRQQLGIDNFKYAFIQKVIGGRGHVYVITVNSRFPDQFIPTYKIKNSKIDRLSYARNSLQPPKLTPPVNIDSFNGSIHKYSYLILRDLAGDTYVEEGEYETI